MKLATLTFLSILFCLPASGKKIYSIPKQDFVKQFSDTSAIEKVYCYNSSGEKFWIIVQNTTILILHQNEGRPKKLMLGTTKYKNGTIEALELNNWNLSGRNKRLSLFKLSDVSAIEVEVTSNERQMAYFDDDSCRSLWKFRNDSLQNSYTTDSLYVVRLLVKQSSDTLTLLENACYHMKFKDGNEVVYGVIQKITQDSIYISNRFNIKAAETDKVEYKVYGNRIDDISTIKMLHSGGLYFRKKDAGEWDISVVRDARSQYHPCGFTKYQNSCQSYFVRMWLTNNGFKLVFESGGKIYWWGA